MNDATENIDPKVDRTSEKGYSGSEELPEIIEPRKPNRHERRKRVKLARMLAMKEKLYEEKRRKAKAER